MSTSVSLPSSSFVEANDFYVKYSGVSRDGIRGIVSFYIVEKRRCMPFAFDDLRYDFLLWKLWKETYCLMVPFWACFLDSILFVLLIMFRL